MKKKTIVLAVILLVFAASCSQQQEPANVSEVTPEVQVSTTPTTIEANPTATSTAIPTITPTPKKAEGFENCFLMQLKEVFPNTHSVYGFNAQGNTVTGRDITYDGSIWEINKDNITLVITNPEVTGELVYFSMNNQKITMTEGALLYITLYKYPLDYNTAYIMTYSPTTNQFIEDFTLSGPYPIISVEIYPDSTVSLTNIGGVTHSYQGNYCVEQDNGSAHIASEALNDEQCVVYTLPNGDEYGYGIDKYGNVSCMQLWMEETETE